MKNTFYLKLATIFALIIALMIPRSFLSDIINERLGWRQQAYTSIGQSWPGEQTLAGPVLVAPYKMTYNVKEKIIDVDKTNKQITKNEKLSNTETIQKEIIKEVTFEDKLYIIPKQLSVNGKVESSMRYRGIYGAPIYNSALEIKGEFNFKPIADLIERNKGVKIDWDKPYLSVLVNDQRASPHRPSSNGAATKSCSNPVRAWKVRKRACLRLCQLFPPALVGGCLVYLYPGNF